MSVSERRQREKEARRLEILEAAREVFSKKGLNSAKMTEIASQAELSIGTLYLYFKSKEDLHTSLSIEILKRLDRKIHEVVALEIGVEEKIEKYLQTFIEVYEYDPDIFINLFHLQSGETLKTISKELLSQITKYSGRAHSAMVNVIKQGISEGIYMDKNPVALADILWSSYSGIVLWVGSKNFLDYKKDFVKSTLRIASKIINRGLRNERRPE